MACRNAVCSSVGGLVLCCTFCSQACISLSDTCIYAVLCIAAGSLTLLALRLTACSDSGNGVVSRELTPLSQQCNISKPGCNFVGPRAQGHEFCTAAFVLSGQCRGQQDVERRGQVHALCPKPKVACIRNTASTCPPRLGHRCIRWCWHNKSPDIEIMYRITQRYPTSKKRKISTRCPTR